MRWEVSDFFCGIGTFSTAICKENDIVFGCDNEHGPCSGCLAVFKANHPNAAISGHTLPKDPDILGLAPVNEKSYWHLSPPCTALSPARRFASEDEQKQGLRLLAWSIAMVIHFQPPGWSIEQVGVKSTIEIATIARSQHPNKVDFLVECASSFGAPQRRSRLLIAPPGVIAILRNQAATAKANATPKTIADAFSARNLVAPATHVRCSAVLSSDASHACVRSIHQPSLALIATRALAFCDENGKVTRSLSTDELLAIAELPSGMHLPRSRKAQVHGIGNGMAAAVSRALVAANTESIAKLPAQPLKPFTTETYAAVSAEVETIMERRSEMHAFEMQKRVLAKRYAEERQALVKAAKR
jgi:site-specific DNA-cytosine methylase